MSDTIQIIKIYTDGSCHTKHRIGAWAAIILNDDIETDLYGLETDTTHNRMELQAILNALEYLKSNDLKSSSVLIYSDSQYAVKIMERKDKLKTAKFKTKKGNSIQNNDLVQQLIEYIETMSLKFIKVKAHQKKSDIRNYNIDVDKRSRKIVRDYIRNNFSD